MKLFNKTIICFYLVLFSGQNSYADTLTVLNGVNLSDSASFEVIYRTVPLYSLKECVSKEICKDEVYCFSAANRKKVNCFTFTTKPNGDDTILICTPESYFFGIESSSFYGCFFINNMPFYCLGEKLESVFSEAPTETVTIAFYKIKDIHSRKLAGSLIDEKSIRTGNIYCDGNTFDVVIESCKPVGLKGRKKCRKRSK